MSEPSTIIVKGIGEVGIQEHKRAYEAVHSDGKQRTRRQMRLAYKKELARDRKRHGKGYH